MFLLSLLFVASASAIVLRPLGVQVNEREICVPVFGIASICADPHVSGKREDQDICGHILGVEICGDPTISGKREQNFDLAEIVANIGKVVHVIDGFVSGTAKRELCVHILGAEVCGNPTVSGKREEQDVCITIAGVKACV
ncbi:uncharacterized protein LOC129923702 [Biomphalaria glabrata]|uniref:Uncharacterized protein LOC129923702 n=1 Tax=Biomphalaria glabrata TaxID=6526 RepID=A0A9W2ZAS0_BIOGL|nr:uncharacterized protein LOC129923702 [Biomphalaria glabrata]